MTADSAKKNADRAKKGASLRKDGAKRAREKVDRVWAHSTLQDMSHKLPGFSQGEVKLGRLLGQGAFGVVHEVKAFHIDQAQQSKNENLPDARTFLSKHCCKEDKKKDARYAVKMLSQAVIDNPDIYSQALMDFAVETRILSNIDEHPNICKLRAVSASRDPFTDDYMLVLDRLYDTVASRILVWSKVHKKCTNKVSKFLTDRGGKNMKALRESQLTSALDLCSAIDFLHQRRIIYRDLKPENVGFDIRDDIKLFDFGLAKELRREYKADEGSETYNLTAMTGSPVYMAPEVANGVPYNEKCDSHSFGILFWEMYGTTTAYEVYTVSKFRERVWNEPFKRPYLQPKWPQSIRDIMENSWVPDPAKRWSIARIMKALHAECSKLYDGDEYVPKESQSESMTSLDSGTRGSMDGLRSAMMRRRSTFVFRGADAARRRSSGESSIASLNASRHKRAAILAELKAADKDAEETERTSGSVEVQRVERPLTVE